jgi:hypothetical protein
MHSLLDEETVVFNRLFIIIEWFSTVVTQIAQKSITTTQKKFVCLSVVTPNHLRPMERYLFDSIEKVSDLDFRMYSLSFLKALNVGSQPSLSPLFAITQPTLSQRQGQFALGAPRLLRSQARTSLRWLPFTPQD